MVGELASCFFFFETHLVLMTCKEGEGSNHDECAELGEVHEIAQVGAREKNKVEDEGAS